MIKKLHSALPNWGKITVLVFALLLVVSFVYFLAGKHDSNSRHDAMDRMPLAVQEGEEFTAHIGQPVGILGTYGDTFIISGFRRDELCAVTSKCLFRSFQRVYYTFSLAELGKDAKIYDSSKDSDLAPIPYIVTVKESDYKTFAKIVITRKPLPLY